MSPVPWATMVPDAIEHLLSVMLCRENPSAVRVRTSQGDGGIDVIVVTPLGWLVDQIKYFPTKLDDSRKGQIRKSFHSLRKYAASKGAVIAAWNLWLPLDPSNDERDWFANLTKDAGYPCEWRGKSHCDGLAAKYPDVIDYYLQDGADRLADTIRQFLGILGLDKQAASTPADLLQAADTEDMLRALHDALNSHDPHYRYDYAVHGTERPLPAPEPLLVAALARQRDGGPWVTFSIYARMREATNERPIPIGLHIEAPPDTDAAQALEDFHTYGAPASVTSQDGVTISGSLGLPGGLATTFTEGTVHLGAAVSDSAAPYDLRMQVLSDAGEVIASVLLKMQPVTAGPGGDGLRAAGTEEHGALGIEIRTNFTTQTVNVALNLNDLTGLHPNEVIAGLRAAAAFGPPNQFRFAAPYGPANHPATAIPADARIALGGALRIVEALCTIQEHTHEQITVPDLTKVPREEAAELVRIAALLRLGSYAATWSHLVETVSAGAIDPHADLETPSPAVIIRPLIAKIGDNEIALGYRRACLTSVRIRAITPRPDGNVLIEFVPGEDNSALIEYIQSID